MDVRIRTQFAQSRRAGIRRSAERRANHLDGHGRNPNLLSNSEIRWELQVRVLPDSEPPFDATVHALLHQTKRPRVEIDQKPSATADAAIEAITAARPDGTSRLG